MFEALKNLENSWYGRLEDIVEELEDLGIDTDCCYISREFIGVSFEEDGEDVEVDIRLGGTERTITIDDVKLVA